MRVNEMFYSLQGEGHFTGTPAVFLRLSGCNKTCSFCDTDHDAFREMTEEEIASEAVAHPSRHIVITGGEPTLQLTPSLCRCLHNEGFFIQMETNGTHEAPEGVDWVTCSPKGNVKATRIDELKVLFWGQSLADVENISAKEYRLQPLDTGDHKRNKEITDITISYILQHPKWKLSLQTHKILNVR